MRDASTVDARPLPSGNVSPLMFLVPLSLSPFLAQVDVCFGRKEWTQMPPILMGLTVLWITASFSIVFNPRDVMRVLRESWEVILAFFVLAIMALVGDLRPISLQSDDDKTAFLPVVDALVFFLALVGSTYCRDDRGWRTGMGMALCLLVGSIFWDSLSPGTFSFLDTRAAGFPINPNCGAAFTALAMIGMLPWREPRLTLFALAVMAFCGAGVFLTLSRSGLLTWLMISGCFVYRALRANGAGSVILLAGIVMPILLYAATAST